MRKSLLMTLKANQCEYASVIELLPAVRQAAGKSINLHHLAATERKSLRRSVLSHFASQFQQAWNQLCLSKPELRTESALAGFLCVSTSCVSRIINRRCLPNPIDRKLLLLRLGVDYREDTEAEAAAIITALLTEMRKSKIDVSDYEQALVKIQAGRRNTS